MIRIEQLTKSYQMGGESLQVLKGIDLVIHKNEFAAIVGPSGSGKSTLMNMLGCLDVPSGGKYELDGQEVSGMDDDELAEIRNFKIGFIFQGFNLLHKLTALENVELPLIYQGLSTEERRERAIQSLEMVGLGDRTDHKPFELSGGQQQRVAIARALVTKPPIILADEPTGNLDSKSGAEIIRILHDLHAKGNTIILITHDPNVAQQAKRMIRISDGLIVEDVEVG